MGRYRALAENIKLRYSKIELAGMVIFICMGVAFLYNQKNFDKPSNPILDEAKQTTNIILYDSRSHIKTINLYPIRQTAE